MNVKLLTEQNLEFLSFKGGCRGSSESTHVKMPHCWKSHVMAHIKEFQILVTVSGEFFRPLRSWTNLFLYAVLKFFKGVYLIM